MTPIAIPSTPPRTDWRSLAAKLALALAILSADQLAKAAVAAHLAFGAGARVAPFLDIVHARNPGAAFSLFAPASGWQRWALSAIAISACAAIAWRLARPHRRLDGIALACLLGGALGNLADRARLGYVVDFIEAHGRGWSFPAFNLADAAIFAGVALLALGQISSPERA